MNKQTSKPRFNNLIVAYLNIGCYAESEVSEQIKTAVKFFSDMNYDIPFILIPTRTESTRVQVFSLDPIDGEGEHLTRKVAAAVRKDLKNELKALMPKAEKSE